MRIFITGASGFVGRNLMAHVLQRGDSVVALSRSSRATKRIEETTSALGYTVTIFEGDLTSSSPQHLSKGMKGCSLVFHSAAKVDGMGPMEPFLQTNVEGTKRIVAAAKEAAVPRLVHISTEALLVRDGQPIHMADETRKLREPPFHAPYSVSKLRAEEAVVRSVFTLGEAAILLSYFQGVSRGRQPSWLDTGVESLTLTTIGGYMYQAGNDPKAGFETVVVRPRSVWGVGPGGMDTAMLPALLESIDNKQFRLFSPGYVTSSTNIQNLVNGAMLAAEKGRPGEVYFVVDGAPIPFKRFQSDIAETQGRTLPHNWAIPTAIAWAVASVLESIPFLGYAKSWGDEMMTRQMLCLVAQELTVDDSKARRELGYKSISFEEGLENMRKDHQKKRAQS